jgi:signal transduction histidine kinase
MSSSALRHLTQAASVSGSVVGYATGLMVPLSTVLIGSRLGMPAFVFEHLTVLFVVAVAVRWGMGPALVAACSASLGDNLLLREPIGRPAISGMRDVFDFILFVVVAVTVGWLVASARQEKARAERAADLERQMRGEHARLIAAVSHDLATPLAAIRGTVQFIRRFGVTPDTDIVGLMTRVDAAAIRATSLVRTLTDVQRLDAGQLRLEAGTADLRPLLTAVVQMLEHSSGRHHLLLTLPDDPVLVRCDRDYLRGVFENVIVNAVKYSPDGGRVEVGLQTEGGEAVVRVRDYGIGISPTALPHIFERAYRAPEAEATAMGLGIGLSIAAEIVQRHDGRIEVALAPPKGTVVLLRFPLASAPAAGADVPSATPPPPDGVARHGDAHAAPAAVSYR